MPVVAVDSGVIFGRVVYVISRPHLPGDSGITQNLGPYLLPISVIPARCGCWPEIKRSLRRLVKMCMGFTITESRKSSIFAARIFTRTRDPIRYVYALFPLLVKYKHYRSHIVKPHNYPPHF